MNKLNDIYIHFINWVEELFIHVWSTLVGAKQTSLQCLACCLTGIPLGFPYL